MNLLRHKELLSVKEYEKIPLRSYLNKITWIKLKEDNVVGINLFWEIKVAIILVKQ